jgi:coenzyme F420-0:L-glutamate ligase/coenzyme F420-1:gamma-L-glutamate ligase
MADLRVMPVTGLPEIAEGDQLGELIARRIELRSGDVVVVSQKAVSKSEGRLRRLADVAPGERARELAERLGKSAQLVELVLAESREVIRAERGILITETRHGFVCANAGIDSSNLPREDAVLLLPEDPDESARRLRSELTERSTGPLAVVVADSFGRAWRLGQADVAIGCAGLAPVDDWRGRTDAGGRPLQATAIATADEIAGAADLVRDKDAGIPVAVLRGLAHLVTDEDGPGAGALSRPRGDDLFR